MTFSRYAAKAAHGWGECPRFYMACPYYIADRGENRSGFPSNSRNFLLSAQKKIRELLFSLEKVKITFLTFSRHAAKAAHGKEVNAKIMIIKEPLNIFAEGKNAVSRRRAAHVP